MISWAIAQAIERSLATPRIKPFLPSNRPQTARYKLIAYSEAEDEIYDLADDPFELRNLIGDPPPEKDQMLEGLMRRYRAMKEEGERLGTGEINPEYIEELKALGYL